MGVSDDENELRSVLRRVLQHRLSDPAGGYAGQVAALRRLRAAFHEEVAEAFAPVFNNALAASPHDDIETKRTLCSAANETLKSLGLAIRDPKTGNPAIVVADFRSADEDAGRFRLEVREPGGRVIRTLSSAALVEFELREASIRQEPLSRRLRGNDPEAPSR
jgi:hypothetical protein